LASGCPTEALTEDVKMAPLYSYAGERVCD
jgi:hypothetical protein